MGLIIWEYMVKSGKTLEQLIEDVYKIVGAFKFERIDLHLTEADKQRIMKNCEANSYKKFGDLQVRKVEDIDGYKFFFDNDEWVMIRPSGTEPVLRTYAEAATTEAAFKVLEKTHQEFKA
jgi:phosphomannomutase